ncbi:Tryptophan biosynthesis protein TrpCF [Serratia symbiotica]|nr:Tryptophan biosynthesis protein TrpCF [Serratia symbiotica]
MQKTILTNIINDKINWIINRKKKQSLISFKSNIVKSERNFYQALKGIKPVFILECKKSSPSKGLICKNFDPIKISLIYKDFATIISVVTEEKYFQGNIDFIPLISKTVTQPILCKDFIIDSYQIYLARIYKADAILLMLSILTNEKYNQFVSIAHSLNMGVLTEIINEEELKRAIFLKAKVIGINNRNLQDLSVDLNRTIQLAPYIPSEITIISESGIDKHSQIRKLNHYVNGFLIGSALMKETDLRTAVCRIIFGDNKICGLTRQEDVISTYKVGAIYGGLIFIPHSCRYINVNHIDKIISGIPLKYVGVFCNEKILFIVKNVERFGLQAVQLHGEENQNYINILRSILPTYCQIWKVLSVTYKLPSRNFKKVDRFLLDNGSGGTGKSFDWTILKDEDLSNTMLSGGLNQNNCIEALKFNSIGLDFNSGVESHPGIKDIVRLTSIFNILRIY